MVEVDDEVEDLVVIVGDPQGLLKVSCHSVNKKDCFTPQETILHLRSSYDIQQTNVEELWNVVRYWLHLPVAQQPSPERRG
jgi:hypothetical protein